MILRDNGILSVDGVSCADLAQRFGTPLYVYSHEQLLNNCRAYSAIDSDLAVDLHYAVKANNNAELLSQIYHAGFGFDIVSGGELLDCLATGIDPKRIVYSGVGKSVTEIQLALEHGIGCLNIESSAELERISALASAAGVSAPVALRVNPHIDANTHPAISTALADSKFGIDHQEAVALSVRAAAMPGLVIKGLVCHLGSQITSLDPYDQACDSLMTMYDQLLGHGIEVEHIGLGGGLGIDYEGGKDIPQPAELITLVRDRLMSRGVRLSLEPGRSIIGNTGITLTRVEYTKPGSTNFVIVDTAMNDIPRPALYNAWHRIETVRSDSTEQECNWQVVGPVCESTDVIGNNRCLRVAQDDLLAVFDTGAYTRVMASNYNGRPKAASVLVCDGQASVIEQRETLGVHKD